MLDVPNAVTNIAMTRISISNIPKWKLVTRYKENKKLNLYVDEFKNEFDIFSLTNEFINFILSLEDKSILAYLTNISLIGNSLQIIINQSKRVEYRPLHNEFFVLDNDKLAYSIYKNTRYSNKIGKLWEPTIDELKDIYVRCILHISSNL